MNLNHIQESLDKTLYTFEQGLNIAGYIPLVSTFSGSLRISYGKVEVIGSVVAAVLTAFVALCNYHDAEARQRGLGKALEILTTYSLHGIANIFRGTIESVPFLSLFTCLPYDLLRSRFSYHYERSSSHLFMNSPV